MCNKKMIILGIETSCDETAAAIVKDGTTILSNVVSSSAEMHSKTGGIIPEQAARQQIKSIVPAISSALSKAGITPSSIDSIAVTAGPGLIGSLLVGVETAKTLSYLWNKPVVPVNHLLAHIYANFISEMSKVKGQKSKIPEFPALALVVSGGHTDLVLMTGHPSANSGQAIKWVGGTRDDAAGEAFDKTARLLRLPYPGGPAISKAADKYLNSQLNMFPRPMINENNFDFSFSGLKTSVLRKVSKQRINEVAKQRYAAEIQEAIVDVLVTKTLKAVKQFKPKSLLLAGGVAANTRLREAFKNQIGKQQIKIDFRVPPVNLCTDNAAYIASYAFFNHQETSWKNILANPQLTITGK